MDRITVIWHIVLAVLCSTVYVNGYVNQLIYDPWYQQAQYDNQDEPCSTNTYVNEAYKEFEDNPEIVQNYKFDFENDDVINYYKYYYKYFCNGFGGVGGYIGYRMLAPPIPYKSFSLTGLTCIFPDSPDVVEEADVFKGKIISFHIINEETDYMEDLRRFTENDCPGYTTTGIIGVYIAPSVSKSKSDEFYLSQPECKVAFK